MIALFVRVGLDWRLLGALAALAACAVGTVAFALIGGLAGAAWSRVQLWAYDRMLEQPPED